MKTFLLGVDIFLSVFLTVSILLQARGTGLGTTWSGGGETYHTRRGLEKILYYWTIVGIALFIIVSIVALVVH